MIRSQRICETMKRQPRSHALIAVSLLSLPLTSVVRAEEGFSIDDSFLNLEMAPEERLVTEALPSRLPETPESGRENAEDLLLSMPEELPSNDAPLGSSFDDAPSFDAESEPVRTPSPAASRSTRLADRKIPPYDRENPRFGFELHAFLAALGTPEVTQIVGTQATHIAMKNFGGGFEWQPRFIQDARIGVLTLGPSVNLYFVDDATESNLSIYSAGLAMKYQFRYFRNQILVPFVGVESQLIQYKFSPSTGLGEGRTTAVGPTFGLMLNLNWLEPSAARTHFTDNDVRRSYAIAEIKRLSSAVDPLAALKNALYFGLRFEL
jgi:hypothetical protein